MDGRTIPTWAVRGVGGTSRATLNDQSIYRDNAVRALIDNEAAFGAIADAIDQARQNVRIMQLAFASDCAARQRPGKTTLFTDLLVAAAGRGVSIDILLNKNRFANTVDDLSQALAGTPNIRVRSLTMRGQVLHAKSVIVDGSVAFLVGSPFTNEYYDYPSHPVSSSYRGERVPGTYSFAGKPVHDVSLEIRGLGADGVDRTFVRLWNRATPDSEHISVGVASPMSPALQAVQIVRTLPRDLVDEIPEGEVAVLESYLRAIAQAKRFIYIENQYFSSGLITSALERALKARPALQIILVLNENPDIPTYKRWQNARLNHLDRMHPRLGVFSLWSCQPGLGWPDISQVYVHSKVAIVDDVWASVGTANLDGISMAFSEEFQVFWNVPYATTRRSCEINALLLDGIDGCASTGEVANFRRALWSRFLRRKPAPATPPSGGWLATWREEAIASVEVLNGGVTANTGGLFVLPYSAYSTEASQLGEAGVADITQFNVID